VNHGRGGSGEIIIGSVELGRIRSFQEMPWWLKMPAVQQTALAAAVTNLAEGLALAQWRVVNIEWSLLILEGTCRLTVSRMEG